MGRRKIGLTEMNKFKYALSLLILLQITITAHMQSDFADLVTYPDCVSSCWLGIEPGITTEIQLEDIFSLHTLVYEKYPLGPDGSTAYFYAITGGYNHPFLRESIIIYANEGIVPAIAMLFQFVEINDVIAEFGYPTHVLHDGTSYALIYSTQNLVFGVIETDKNYVFKLQIMDGETLSNAYLDGIFWDELETCTETSQLCEVVAAMESLTCDIRISSSTVSSLQIAITSANGTPEPDTICLEGGTYTLDTPITSDITLVGLGAGAEISGSLQVSGAGRLTLRNMSVNP
jgi:hypothetical protein